MEYTPNILQLNQPGELQEFDVFSVLRQMRRALRRLWLLCVIILILGAGGMGAYTYVTFTPMYMASATFSVSVQNENSSLGTYYNTITATEMETTFPYILTSGLLSKTVADDLGLSYVPSEITATALEGTSLFTIEVRDSDAQQAYDVLESLIENYPVVAEYVIGKTDLEQLDNTGVPDSPYNSPDYLRNILIGLCVAAIIDLIILCIAVLVRRTVKNEEDIQNFLHVELIGSVPALQQKSRRKGEFPAINIKSDRVSESYKESIRTLQVRIETAMEKDGGKVLLVTSSVPQEGKSTIAANIALAFAATQKTVTLVDCDLRGPSDAKILGLENKAPGLSDYLEGKIGAEDAIQYLEESGLYLISGGQSCETQHDKTSGPRMLQLIRALRKASDYVIIDTAPVGLFADTVVQADYVDATLLVIREDFARVDRIIDAFRSLSESDAQLAGCVMNCVREEAGPSSRYGYGKYGKYGKYGNYGKYYGDEE